MISRKEKREKEKNNNYFFELMKIQLHFFKELNSMRSMTYQFNKDETIENIKRILGIEKLDELPHYDTINDYLSTIHPSELEDIITYMVKELLRKRCFDEFRINGKYWGVIFD